MLKLKIIFSILILTTLLTDRWFPINPKAIEHPTQIQLLNDFKTRKADNFVIVAGRRSFKTERFAKRLLVRECLKESNKLYYVGAPTRSQAKEIFWSDLKALSSNWAVKNIREVELKIEYVTGCSLKVIGLKEFKRVQGQLMHGIVISEYQDCEPEVYNESVEPMINDTGGFCIKEGRPLGKNHFFDDYSKGGTEKGWGSYHWTAEDILTTEQIERAKRNLALQDYKREYLASFDTLSGNPYYAYSSLNNKPYTIKPQLPIIMTCDFNATEKPMSWVLGQRFTEGVNDITHWFKCFSFPFTNTETMCGIVDECFKETGSTEIHLYGDYAGNQVKSNSSETDWQIITNYFRNKVKIDKRLKPCKSIRDSIGATNAQLCNSFNERKQFIVLEDCMPLVKDFEKCEWKDNGRELKDNDDLRGHCSRAVDYYNDYEHSVRGKPTVEWVVR